VGHLIVFLIPLVFAISGTSVMARLAGAVGCVAALAWWCLRPTITTRFALDERCVSVTRARVWSRTRIYNFEQVLLMGVESNFVRMRLFDGTTETLSHEHDSASELQRVVAEVCATTGLNQAGDLIVPNSHGRPFAVTGAGIGIYIEGPVAVLSVRGCASRANGQLSYGRTTAVFNNLNRHVQITRVLLRERSETFTYDEIDNIGIEERYDEGGVDYRMILELSRGRRIALGSGAMCSRYEIDLMSQQLLAHSGIRSWWFFDEVIE